MTFIRMPALLTVVFITLAAFALAGCDAFGETSGGNSPASHDDGLSPQTHASIERVFRLMDRNRDGVITRAELESMDRYSMTDHATGETLTGEAAIDAFFARYDREGNERVTLEDMLDTYRTPLPSRTPPDSDG